MSLSFIAVAYQHINRGGAATLLGISQEARYNYIRESRLADLGLDAAISSLEEYSSSTATSNVILTSNRLSFASLPSLSVPLGDFNGEFRQIVRPRSAGSVLVNLTSHAFNDNTRSILLVNTARRPEFRVSFRDVFLEEWKDTLDTELGSNASRKGDPLMTWEMFPEGISYLDPNLTYLKIHQSLNINLDWWPDYDASITYHIFLFLDGARRLRGYCQRWAAWVEGGIKSGGIMDRLWPKVVSGVGTINAKLATRLGAIPAVNDFFYLPGRQLTPLADLIGQGSTLDDVTIVVEP